MISIGGCRILGYEGTRGENWSRPFSKGYREDSIPSKGILRRPHLGGMETIGSKERIHLYLPLSNGKKRKRPCP